MFSSSARTATSRPVFALVDPALRNKMQLLRVDFSTFDRDTPGRGRLSRAVFRRLFLDRILPESYERIISVDSDMLIRRAGLGRLARNRSWRSADRGRL